MSKKSNDEAKDFESLRELGFELRGPQDEFSYQPDSGSSIGGMTGKQEYGIDSDYDAEGNRSQRSIGIRSKSRNQDNADLQPSFEEQLDNAHNLKLQDADLYSLVSARLHQHPNLFGCELDVQVKNADVLVQGKVRTDSAKLLVDEIVQAMPGVTHIYNMVEIER